MMVISRNLQSQMHLLLQIHYEHDPLLELNQFGEGKVDEDNQGGDYLGTSLFALNLDVVIPAPEAGSENVSGWEGPTVLTTAEGKTLD